MCRLEVGRRDIDILALTAALNKQRDKRGGGGGMTLIRACKEASEMDSMEEIAGEIASEHEDIARSELANGFISKHKKPILIIWPANLLPSSAMESNRSRAACMHSSACRLPAVMLN